MVKQPLGRRQLATEATKERILAAAEKLFSEQGLDGVSVREIAAAAKLDVAMINYHFGSKLGLYRAVFHRRIDQLTEQRLGGLDEVLARFQGRAPELRDVVQALIAPNILLRSNAELGGVPFARLIVREMTDPNERERGIISEMFDQTAYRYIEAIAVIFPGAPRAEIHWAYHFAIGTLVHAMASTGRLEYLSRGACQMSDPDVILGRLVPFVESGFEGCLGRYRARAGQTTKAPVSPVPNP
jgi:AcrR family transcriptional regulator